MSEVNAEILIIILIALLAVIIYALISGAFSSEYFKKSVYIGGTAAPAEIPQPSGTPSQVLTFLPASGDPFYLSGMTREIFGANATLYAVSPDGRHILPDTSSLSGNLYGKTLYIYPNSSSGATQCDYQITDAVPRGYTRPMVIGCWTVQILDQQVHVLADSYSAHITSGTTSLPSACGYVSGSGGRFYRSDCTPIDQTAYGSITTYSNGPGNMSYSYFNGASYVSLPNDPTLSFNGQNLGISLWMKPDSTTPNTWDTSNWYTLIGKGQLNADSSENDNYQLVQIGNQLYFEWNDATTGQHYHVMTTSGPVTANQWNYVTVSVVNGKIALYNNGVELPIKYYASNYPTDTNAISPVTVNLKVNDNNILIGKQNSANPSDDFYFRGDMGGVSVYDRGLTPSEIQYNYNGEFAC